MRWRISFVTFDHPLLAGTVAPGVAHIVLRLREGSRRFQQAKTLELRAVMSLARLWQQQGKVK